MKRTWQSTTGAGLATLWLMAIALSCPSATMAQGNAPGTPADAVALIDLSTLPLAPGAKPNPRQTAVQLYYTTSGRIADIFNFHARQLKKQGWTETKKPLIDDDSASAKFQKSGYTLLLMVVPGEKKGLWNASIDNLGNVDIATLPPPPVAQALDVGRTFAMWSTNGPAARVHASVREKLLPEGWVPYSGGKFGIESYRQRGVLLNVSVNESPISTSITYSTEMLPVEYPLPATARNAYYESQSAQLTARVPEPLDKVVAYYRQELASLGWTPASEAPELAGLSDRLHFRNSSGAVIQLDLKKGNGETNVTLSYENPAASAKSGRTAR